MRIYYLNFNYLIRRAITVLLALLFILLLFKVVQYNLFKPAISNFDPIYQGSTDQKKIALTCNVVWGEEYIPGMLEVLKKNNVSMTFFMGGKWVEDFPELTKEIAKNHELGNHSYSHPHPTFISKSENISEIKQTDEAVYKITKVRTRLYAPPYGEFNKTVLQAAGESGYRTILWSIDTIDWERPAPDTIVKRVTGKAHNGAIVLMHPTDPTVKALPSIIAALKGKGYQLTTVSDVLGIK
ncbi:polysaccharide deacetylase family protein [Phosphitispora fastidiosa]|uniref:polysaccharide deacetylase family protein n=1 Tax=Phosphitispora fastidiosa TaxID=2837202 RepID=UPI001E377D14|nr:polysaccharide deacetylase family protein [Phosphitispora fastidiosa]MBU7005576.1 putative sporulation protein (polysaccharide deacetylase family) [Phosphitispora fastidiosa]